ncbi:peptidase S26B signal peptidase [Clostridium sp. CAG:356]|nr:peptidase S26B signal peptidase [Clostridium sp. CAG:356]
MKSEKIKIYVIEIALIIFFLLAMIFNKVITRQILAIVLLVFMGITTLLIKTYKMDLTNKRQIILLLTGIGVIYVAVLYLIGIFAGFYNATVKLSLWSIWKYIIPYIVIIISSEMIRKKIVLKEDKISKIIILVIMVMLDVILTTNIYNLNTAKDYFTLVSFVIFASIANNLLFNYIEIQYRNAKAIIIYRIITTVYVYVFPIIPDLYIFLESIIKMVVPYIIYIILENVYSKQKLVVTIETRKKERIISTIVCIITVIIVMLISCKFKYGVLVIGSGSMTGTINKGDIILYEKYKNTDDIKVGNIIVFYEDDIKVIHRIIDQKLMGEETRYYTKGDANQKQDEGYRETKDIIGQVKARIPYMGWFTLWINDWRK